MTQGICLGILILVYIILLGYNHKLIKRFRMKVHHEKALQSEYQKERRKGLFVMLLTSLTFTVFMISVLWPQLTTYADLKSEEDIFLFFVGTLILCGLPLFLHGVGAIIAYQRSSERILDE